MTKGHIFFVEDDEALAFVVKDNLTLKGFAVNHYEDGATALQAFGKGTFDLCLLDVMLPKMDGFALAEQIRIKNKSIPILFLTAKGMQEDRLEGFKRGGDDYIIKPFSMEELIFRIEVFLRRKLNTNSLDEQFEIGKYTFNYTDLSLIFGNNKKHLTQKEADVLRYLCMHQSGVVKRDELLLAVWGSDDYFLGRSLDVFISKLRKYLAQDDNVQIHNRHGVGFELLIKS